MPDPRNPQVFNRYSYVLNNPLRYSDPSGRIPITFPTGGINIPLDNSGSTFSAGGDSGFGDIGSLSFGSGTFGPGFSTLNFSTVTYTFDSSISALLAIIPPSSRERLITEILPEKFPDLFSISSTSSTDFSPLAGGASNAGQSDQSNLPVVNSSGGGSLPIFLAEASVSIFDGRQNFGIDGRIEVSNPSGGFPIITNSNIVGALQPERFVSGAPLNFGSLDVSPTLSVEDVSALSSMVDGAGLISTSAFLIYGKPAILGTPSADTLIARQLGFSNLSPANRLGLQFARMTLRGGSVGLILGGSVMIGVGIDRFFFQPE